ncbi:hypothetical protein [Methanoregula formicica]|uniref:hypothetical protein n=1 Tax=Methanoregula formicica TaxID=882104 RepID=UPI00130D9F32|nr:hypothetical protein [Methanoregula formicica]
MAAGKKVLKIKPGEYGEHQIEKVDKLLRNGYSVIVIEEDPNGNEINRSEFSP